MLIQIPNNIWTNWSRFVKTAITSTERSLALSYLSAMIKEQTEKVNGWCISLIDDYANWYLWI